MVSRHALRNAMLPVVTIIGLQIGTLLSGAVLTETIFNLPGVGKTLYDAITSRDYAVIQGFVLVIAIGFLVVNLVVDMSATPSSIPRIRLELTQRWPRPCAARRDIADGSQVAPCAGRPACGATRSATSCASASPDRRPGHPRRSSSSWRLFAPVIAPYDPNQVLFDARVRSAVTPPCIHLLGCPETSRSTSSASTATAATCSAASSTARASRSLVGFVTVGFAIVIGALPRRDRRLRRRAARTRSIMRFMDVLLVFPALLLAIAIVTVLGLEPDQRPDRDRASWRSRSTPASCAPRCCPSARHDFVTASRALGELERASCSGASCPTALTPIIVAGTLGIAGAVLDVAALSFLGLGAQPPTAEWGSMIGQERNYIFTAPHLVIFPGIALTLTVLGFNLLGDGLRDALDPRLNR